MNYLRDFIFGPAPVTRDQLGKLGGNPHFRPPPHDRQSQEKQGVVEADKDSLKTAQGEQK